MDVFFDSLEFNALPQNNVLNRKRWTTRAELKSAIVYWIEHTYNRMRRQRILGKCTPVEVEYEIINPPITRP